MYGRPTILFPLALLALLALLTLWIDHSVRTPEQKSPGTTRHDPDYYLHNFVTSKTDAGGNLQYMLAATSMTHYPDDDSTKLERPKFTQYGVDKPYTQIEGQRGLVSGNGEVVEVMDNVIVIRQATEGKGEMRMLTEYIKIFPNKDLATTDRPVVITQAPKTVIHATGMVFDKKQQTVTLLKRVRVHYEKPVVVPNIATKKTTRNQAGKNKTDNKSTGKKNSAVNTSTMTRNTTNNTQKNKRASNQPKTTIDKNNTGTRR